MYIKTVMVKGRKYYQVRAYLSEDGRVRERVVIHLGKHPTIADAFRETEERYFAARKGRENGPLTADDQTTWARLDQLYDVRRKHDGEHPKISVRLRAEYRRRFLARAKRVPPWCQTILGLPEKATPDEIRAARDRLAKQHHPDLGGDPAIMIQINEAYDRLTE